MTYCLDTDICIFAMKGKHPRIQQRMSRLRPYQILIPSIVKAELLLGALKSARPDRTRKIVDDFLFPFEIAPLDDSAAEIYARIRHALETSGRLIGPNDLIIAATALAQGATLVTHNTDEFSRVKGLKTEDWTAKK